MEKEHIIIIIIIIILECANLFCCSLCVGLLGCINVLHNSNTMKTGRKVKALCPLVYEYVFVLKVRRLRSLTTRQIGGIENRVQRKYMFVY